MQQPLFPNDSEQIKAHHLKRLRELRDEFQEIARKRIEQWRLNDLRTTCPQHVAKNPPSCPLSAYESLE